MIVATTFGDPGWVLGVRSPQGTIIGEISSALDPPTATGDSIQTPTPTPTESPTQHNSPTKTARTPLSPPAKSSTIGSAPTTTEPPVGNPNTSSAASTLPPFSRSKSPPEGGLNLTSVPSHTSSGSTATASDQGSSQSLSLNISSSSEVKSSAAQSVVPTGSSIPSVTNSSGPAPSLASVPNGHHHISAGVIAAIVVITLLLLLTFAFWIWRRNAAQRRTGRTVNQSSTDLNPFSGPNNSRDTRLLLAQYTTTEKTEKYRHKFAYVEGSGGEGASSSHPQEITEDGPGRIEAQAQGIPLRIQYRLHEDAGRAVRGEMGNEGEDVIIDLPPDYSTLADARSQIQRHMSRIAGAD